jgi:hypothetical protein
LWLNGKTLRGKTATKELQPRMARIKSERFLIREICEIRGKKSSRDELYYFDGLSCKGTKRSQPDFTTKGTKITKKKEVLYHDFVSFAFFVVRKFLRNERIEDIALKRPKGAKERKRLTQRRGARRTNLGFEMAWRGQTLLGGGLFNEIELWLSRASALPIRITVTIRRRRIFVFPSGEQRLRLRLSHKVR